MTWKEYMTYWTRKLLTQIISIKVWLMSLFTVLLIYNKLNIDKYTILMTTLIGARAAYHVAGVVKNKINVEKGE